MGEWVFERAGAGRAASAVHSADFCARADAGNAWECDWNWVRRFDDDAAGEVDRSSRDVRERADRADAQRGEDSDYVRYGSGGNRARVGIAGVGGAIAAGGV